MSVVAERVGDRIHLTSQIRDKELIRAIPGSKWRSARDDWELPLTWSSCLALRNVFGARLEIGPELTAWAYDYRETVLEPATALRDVFDYEPLAHEPDLFPHQRADVAFLTTVKRGLLLSDPGTGKQQPVSEPVLTPSGWRPIGDLQIGDLVIGSDGSPTAVTGVFPQTETRVFKVLLNDGCWTYAGPDHLWTTRTHNDSNRNKDYRVITTDQIKNSLGQRWEIPLITPAKDLSESGDLDFYLLGVILGDGAYTENCSVSLCTDIRILESLGYSDRVRPHGTSEYTGYAYLTKSEMTKYVQARLLSSEKYVSDHLLHDACPGNRLALLQGLLDTDGSPTYTGGVEFSSTSERLAHAVASLTRSLGGVARMNKPRVPQYTHQGEKRSGQMSYRVHVKLPPEIDPFRLDRKLEKYIRSSKYLPKRVVRSVEFSHDEASVCISVAAPDSLYVTRDHILTHNTLSTIRSLKRLEESGTPVKPGLIVAPASVKLAWQREFDQWWPGQRVQVVSGTLAQRRKQLTSDADFYVMNYESVRAHSRLAPYGAIALRLCVDCGGEDPRITPAKCDVHLKELNNITFASVVVDEGHRLIDQSSQQSRAILAAAPLAETPIRYVLTGTPISQSIADLWSLLHFIDPDEWSVRSKWLDRMCNVLYNSWYGIIGTDIKPEMQQEFDSTILHRMRRVPLDAVVKNLPPVLRERRDIDMTPKQAKAYRTMADNLMAMYDGDLLVADSPMTAAIRLLQTASSYGTVETTMDDDGNPRTRLVLAEPSSKVSAVLDVLEDVGDQSVVVFAVSRQLLMLLSAKLTKEGIAHGMIVGGQRDYDRQEAIDEFQAGKTKVILVSYGAGGTGITLTAASVMVTMQRSWSMIEEKQAMARCRRIGSERHEHITRIDLVAPDTIEEAVLDALDSKGETLENLVRDREMMARALRGEKID